MAPAAGTSAQQWQDTLMVNVVSLDLLVGGLRSALTESAAVIAISSVHAQATTEGICAYATSKAALEGWVRAAALDLGPTIRTVAVTLGAVDGPKLQEGFARWGGEAQARMDVLNSRTPAGRIGTAAEVAGAIVWLTSPAAGFITGTSIAIDGGALARLGSE
jgi:NAD(P)-dependent dehydrogenase (short-subunit alcohol dehydrogenase family)